MVLLEIIQRFKGHFLNELRVSFDIRSQVKYLTSKGEIKPGYSIIQSPISH